MQQCGFECVIKTEGQSEPALRPAESSRSLDEVTTQSVQFLKDPKRGALLGSMTLGWVGHHLKLTGQIMGQNGTEEVSLIAGQSAHGDVIHLALALELAEEVLLSPPTVVEGHDFLHPDMFVGQDHLEVVAPLMRDKQIQLDGFLVLLGDFVAQKDKAVAPIPTLGLPGGFKERPLVIEVPPAQPPLDHDLEFHEPLEGHRHGELHPVAVQGLGHLVAKKGAIHTDFNLHPRQGLPEPTDTLQHEGLGSVGVMDVTRTVQDIEDLTGLGNGTKQRVIAAGALLLFVKPHGGPFGPPTGALHRAVEVQRDALELQLAQSFHGKFPHQRSKLLHAPAVGLGQGTAQRGHIGKSAQPQKPLHHGVVVIGLTLAQPAIPQQQVDHQREHDEVVSKDRATCQVAKATAQLLLEPQPGKQALKDDQTGKRGQGVVFKMEGGNLAGFTVNRGSAMFHLGGLLLKKWCSM